MPKIFFNVMQKFAFLFLLLAIFSIHLPTKFMDVALIFLFLCWSLSGNYEVKLKRIKSNVGALSAIALFIFFALSVSYASVPLRESLSGLFKYHGLLLIPMIVSLGLHDSERDMAVLSFIAGALFVLLFCYGKWLGLVPMDFVRHDASPGNYIVFRHSISQNIFIAIAAYFMMMKAKTSRNHINTLLWVLAFSLSFFCLLFLVDSRSAQIAMALLIVFFLYQNWERTYIKYIAGYTLCLALTAYTFSPHMRFMDVKDEIKLAKTEQKVTSSGQRLELWNNTWTLIKRYPVLGGGAGSFVHDYATYIPKDRIVTVLDYKNVHNQYLQVLQEFGFLGLSLFVTFFFYQWEAATRITLPQRRQALYGLIIAFAVTSFFNSMFWGGEAKCYYLLAGVFLSALANLKKNPWRISFLSP